MNSSRYWCDDEDALVRELRRARGREGAPRVRGYADLRELGRGGQGVVYVGRQLSTNRRVAIKVVLDGALASRGARRRFEREIELVAGLRHPNVVRVYDCGETDDGRLYYVMEYVEGTGLDELMCGGRGPGDGDGGNDNPNRREEGLSGLGTVEKALEVFAKICDGVQHAHQMGVIHRDLKPSNVRIDGSGEPHVLDFGLAKLAEGAADVSAMTRAGGFMGSLPWASPEQAAGTPGSVDIRSDVYSLGVMLYQGLTGAFPYRVDGPLGEALDRILSSEPRPPREIRRELSDEVSTIVLKSLSKEADRRYQSAGELGRDIRRYLAGEPIEAKRDSAWYSVRKKLDRYRTAVWAVSGLLAASIVFSVGMVMLRDRALEAEGLAADRLAQVEKLHRAEVAARGELEEQVSKNASVREFLDTTLRAVDPWKHPGRDVGPLREMLDGAAARLEGAFTNQPEVEAAIAGTLGWDYKELGAHEPAERLLRRALELLRTTRGEEDEETQEAMNGLAMLMTELGRHEEAEALFGELLGIQERTRGKEDARTLVTVNNLALDIDWQGRSAEAEALYRRALEAQTRLFGDTDRDRLHTLNNLAACLPGLGKMEEAERLGEELIAGRAKSLGAEHPETLGARANQGHLLISMGRFEEAEGRLRELITAMEERLGPDHPMTIGAIHNLADAVSNQGRHEEGLALARRALAAQERFYGADHPTTLNGRNELACTLIELKRWEEAVPMAREVFERSKRVLGESDWRTLNSGGNLAFALKQDGELAEAEAIWRMVIGKATPGHEASAGVVCTARANLGALLTEEKRWEEAEVEFRGAIAMQEAMGQGEHWRTAFMRVGLGEVLMETGRWEEAGEALVTGHEALRAALGEAHEKTVRAGGLVERWRAGRAAARGRTE